VIKHRLKCKYLPLFKLNAGRIGALLIRRVANRFLRQESQIILGEPRGGVPKIIFIII
jgi:hypothetical protein